MPKINDNLTFTFSLPWLIQLIVLVASVVILYFSIKGDISRAANSPVSCGEYTMRVEFTADEILELEERIEKLEKYHETK